MAYGAFFILSVEIPDVEGDRSGGNRNLLVRCGIRKGLRAALYSVLAGSVFWLLLWLFAPSQVLDYRAFLILSLVPAAVGILGVWKDPSDRNNMIKQVKLNFSSLIAFLLLLDIDLALVPWNAVQQY